MQSKISAFVIISLVKQREKRVTLSEEVQHGSVLLRLRPAIVKDRLSAFWFIVFRMTRRSTSTCPTSGNSSCGPTRMISPFAALRTRIVLWHSLSFRCYQEDVGPASGDAVLNGFVYLFLELRSNLP